MPVKNDILKKMRNYAFQKLNYSVFREKLEFNKVKKNVMNLFEGVRGKRCAKIHNRVAGLVVKYHNSFCVPSEVKIKKRAAFESKLFAK